MKAIFTRLKMSAETVTTLHGDSVLLEPLDAPAQTGLTGHLSGRVGRLEGGPDRRVGATRSPADGGRADLRTRAAAGVLVGLHGTALTLVCALAGCAATPPPPTALDQQPPELVNAFFGLDDSLPPQSIAICPEAPGRDGMPVTFSRRVVGNGFQGAGVDPAAFTVVTQSGQQKKPVCASLRPAVGPDERHTVLLVGDFGGRIDDPPVQVVVTGHLPLEGGADGFGLAVDVTPLEAGPSIVLAMGYPAGGRDFDCPEGTRQVVDVVWSGGVVPGPGQTPESHREMYSVTTETGEVKPIALRGVDDNDNYERLCLDTESPATRVNAAERILQDPRGDLNPPTSLNVVR